MSYTSTSRAIQTFNVFITKPFNWYFKFYIFNKSDNTFHFVETWVRDFLLYISVYRFVEFEDLSSISTERDWIVSIHWELSPSYSLFLERVTPELVFRCRRLVAPFLLWNTNCNFPLSGSFLFDSDYSRLRLPFRGTNLIQSGVNKQT